VFHVYTLITRRRFRIGPGVSESTPFALDADAGVYCNGAIHWCTKSKFCVYFDVDTQCLKYYPMPPLSDSEAIQLRYSFIPYFGASGGRLHLMLRFKQTYDIFQLKENFSGWLLRHRIDLNPIRVQFPHINWHWPHVNFYIYHTAKDHNKKKKSSLSVLIVGKEGAVFHDPLGKTSSKLCDFEMDTATSLYIQNTLPCRRPASYGAYYQHRVHQHFENLC
jgi:NADH:ubiquinone oxidoreductase subunit